MIEFSQEEIRVMAGKAGLARLEASVFAVIAYWEQVDGGKKIGPGQNWRWRSHADIGEAISYSAKSVQRAVKSLKSAELVKARRIRNPMRPGETVNAYRLTGRGHSILEGQPKGTAQAGRFEGRRLTSSERANCSVRTGQDGASIKQRTRQDTGRDTKQREREDNYGRDIFYWECFEGEGGDWEELRPTEEQWFWSGYSKLIRVGFDETVGSMNPKRLAWTTAYLSIFKEQGYSPRDAIDALALSLRDWTDMSVELLVQSNLPEWRWNRKYPQPYDLGVLGHVIFNYYRKNWPLEGL